MIKKPKSKCPDCDKYIFYIESASGSMLAADFKQHTIWGYDITDKKYHTKTGYMTHNYTCVGKNNIKLKRRKILTHSNSIYKSENF